MKNHTADESLFQIAVAQGGYFTAKQAVQAGFCQKNHAYYLKTRVWIRDWRGIYRLARFPEPDDGQYILWSLWSGNRRGEPQGVYSHETALSLFEMSDANPAKLHMIVPPGFRKSTQTPKILVLYKQKIAEGTFEQRTGYNVLKPLPNILMLIEEGETTEEILIQALRDGIRRGYFLEEQLLNLTVNKKTKATLKRLLGQTK